MPLLLLSLIPVVYLSQLCCKVCFISRFNKAQCITYAPKQWWGQTEWFRKRSEVKEAQKQGDSSGMFLPDCIYIWWWEHFIYGFSHMGHPDYLSGSLLAIELTDLSGPSADVKTTSGITRQCCYLKVNRTGLYLLEVEKEYRRISRQKKTQQNSPTTKQESNATVNYVIQTGILGTISLTKTNRSSPATPWFGHHKLKTDLFSVITEVRG